MSTEGLAPGATVVIVGASLAGLRAAETLRRLGHPGRVVVVGDEQQMPYDRPPLSKGFLAGDQNLTEITLRTEADLDGVEFVLGQRAADLNASLGCVTLEDGTPMPYDGLILATGATPRALPGCTDMPRVHTLRTAADSIAIRNHLRLAAAPARLVVIGAGFLGAEVASTASRLGAQVTVVEAAASPFERNLGADVGALVASLQARHNVQLLLSTGVTAVEQFGDEVLVSLSDGSILGADCVVVAIGCRPNTDWLAGSGLTIDDGVACDAFLFAASNVVAAGDVARFWYEPVAGSVRNEHWTSAAESGVAAAENLLRGRAAATAFKPTCFFWSDQFGARLQLLGHRSAADDVVIVHQERERPSALALYHRHGKLTAVFGLNQPKQVAQARRLVEAHVQLDEARAWASSALSKPRTALTNS